MIAIGHCAPTHLQPWVHFHECIGGVLGHLLLHEELYRGGAAVVCCRHELHRVAHVCPTSEMRRTDVGQKICFRHTDRLARWVRFLAPRPWM